MARDSYSSRVWRSETRSGWHFHLLAASEPFVRGIVDVEAVAPDGTRWLGDIATLEGLAGIMDGYRQSGEGLSGRYLALPSNLVVIADPTFATAFDALEDLATRGELTQE